MENSAQWNLVPDLIHAMVGFLGIVCQNNLATHFVHSFLTCEKCLKFLINSSMASGKGCASRTGVSSGDTKSPRTRGSYTATQGKKITLQGTTLSSSLWISSRSCFQQVPLLFNRPATKSHLPFNKKKVSYTFPTLPLSVCSSTNLCVIISTEACRLFYWKNLSRSFCWNTTLKTIDVKLKCHIWGFFQLSLFFSWLLRTHEHSFN